MLGGPGVLEDDMEYSALEVDMHRMCFVRLRCSMAGVSADSGGMLTGQDTMMLQSEGTVTTYTHNLGAYSADIGTAELRDIPAKDSRLPRCVLIVYYSHRSLSTSVLRAVKSHPRFQRCYLFDLFCHCPHLVHKNHDLLCFPFHRS